MTNEERGELEKLVLHNWRKYRDAQMGRGDGEGGAVASAINYCMTSLRATLDRLTDEQSGGVSAKRAAELADAIVSEVHESTTHPDRREIEMEPMRLHEGDLLVVDDVEYEVSAAVHGRTLDRVTLRRLHRDPEPPDSTEPEDDVVRPSPRSLDIEAHILTASYHIAQAKKTVTDLWAQVQLAEADHRLNTARKLLHDTGILTTEREG